MSIGGNDSGFATIGITCVAPGDCGKKEAENNLLLQNLTQVPLALGEVYAELGTIAQANQIPVVTVPYPSPVNENQCRNVTLSQSEVEFVNQPDFIIRTDSALAKFSHLGDSRRHQLHRPTVDVRFPRTDDQPRELGALQLHPDVNGHRVMAEKINSWWDANAPLIAVRGTDPDIDDPDREAALAITPQCSMEVIGQQEEEGKKCEDQARVWVLDEAHDWVNDNIWILIIAIAGLWLLFIALFGAYRRNQHEDDLIRGL